jgi:hypothetical protein
MDLTSLPPPGVELHNRAMWIHGWSPGSAPDLAPRTIVYFALIPDPLPMPSGHHVRVPMPPLEESVALTSRPAIDATVVLRIWQVETISGVDGRSLQALDAVRRQVVPMTLLPDHERVNAAASTEEPQSIDTYRTAVEMRVQAPMLTESSILDGFRRGFDALRELHRAYRVSARAQIRPLTVERLHQLAPFAAIDESGRWDRRTGWVIAHRRLAHEIAPEVLQPIALAQLEWHMDSLRRAHPMALFWERMLPAYASFDDGDFTGAILDAAIAVEMLVDAALAAALWDSGVPADIAYKKKDRGSIVGRVRTRLARALDDDPAAWVTEGETPGARWKRDLADLRNHVVHDGYIADREDAVRGIQAAEDLTAFILERMLDAADRRPRAALMLMGESAIHRAGRWTARLETFAGLDWLADFHDWRTSALEAYERARV